MNHDIIFVKRTGRWVCKCGKNGINEKSKKEHEQEIKNEIEFEKKVNNLINDVEKVDACQ